MQKTINKTTKNPKNKQVELVRYNPSHHDGLSTEEINNHIAAGAVNKKPKDLGKSYLSIIISNVFTLFNIIYIIIFLLLRSASLSDPLQKFPITNYNFVLVVTINLLIGTIQEIRSKATIDKLKLLNEPMVMVVRNGYNQEIKTNDLVLDDVMVLTAGKEIVSDSIMLEGNLEVNESQITGESVSIKKEVGDILYSGSFVASGSGYAKVDKVGKDNAIEQLAAQAKIHKKYQSQILSSLQGLIKIISIFLVISGIMMLLENYDFRGFAESDGAFQKWFYNTIYLGFIHKIPLFSTAQNSWFTSITSTCTALIGMIPSGLLMMTSAALVLGVIRLSKHNTLVQDIYCVEMLARVDCLCLDKTGTITDGTMKVKEVIDYTKGKIDYKEIIASINYQLNELNVTGIALQNYFGVSGNLTVINKIPFSSERKYSGIITDKGSYILGAPEFVLLKEYEKYQEVIENYAKEGLRVLALASYPVDIIAKTTSRKPKLICLITIEDQIRDDAYDTIKYFKENGVEVKVISGDNPVTVSTIARKVGIVAAEKYVSLEGKTIEEVKALANKFTVFGRVKPEQKEALVKALKENGKTVAMTGDGVNDILALKEADCSVVMASGNDAVKSVAKLVLLDSKFSSMPKIVEEGRRAINNIQQVATLYLLKTIFILALALLTIVGFFKKTSGDSSFPFSNPTQLLMIEMFVIGIPSTILALQPNHNKVTGNFLKNIIQRSFPGSLAIVISIIITYLLCKPCGFTISMTKTIVVLCATFIGIMVLYQACRPFNKLKIALFSSMLIICVGITTISLTGRPKIKLFNINVSEKVQDAFLMDNLFSSYVVKLNSENIERLESLESSIQSIYITLNSSDNTNALIIANDAKTICENLETNSMIDLMSINNLLEDYKEYSLHDPSMTDQSSFIEKVQLELSEIKENSVSNLTGVMLFFSMLALSYILMTVFSYVITFINRLSLAREVRRAKNSSIGTLDDDSDFFKFE